MITHGCDMRYTFPYMWPGVEINHFDETTCPRSVDKIYGSFSHLTCPRNCSACKPHVMV